jgi:hypothetical protein
LKKQTEKRRAIVSGIWILETAITTSKTIFTFFKNVNIIILVHLIQSKSQLYNAERDTQAKGETE